MNLTVTGTPMVDNGSPLPILHWRINLVRRRSSRNPGVSVSFDTARDPGIQPYPIAWVLCVLARQLCLLQH